MKELKLLLLIGTLASCSQESMLFSEETSPVNEESTIEVNNNLGHFVGVSTSTYQNVVQYLKFGGNEKQTRSMQEVNSMLEPYVMDDDTVAWIVNYDEGWELLSNDRRSPLVLARSKSGRFTLDSSNKAATDFLTDILNQQSCIKKRDFQDGDTIHGDWSVYYLPVESVLPEQIKHNEKVTRLPQDPDDEEEHYGYWLLLSQTEIDSTETTHPHAITTHWHQGMNTYIPNNRNVGCVGIAGAQYLYYLYTQNHWPATIVNTATLNSTGSHYIFSGNSTTVWNNISNDNYRDLFIGYVAESVDTKFENGSGAELDNLIDFINNFGYSLSTCSYNANNIALGIASKGAILCGARRPRGGHLFIIDYLKTKRYTSRCLYGWVETDSAGNPLCNLNPPYDESMFEYTLVQNRGTQQTFMRINWGWENIDHNYDEDDYSIAAIPLLNYDSDFQICY